MHCKICKYRPKGHVRDVLDKLYAHFQEKHKRALEKVISPVELIGKDKEYPEAKIKK